MKVHIIGVQVLVSSRETENVYLRRGCSTGIGLFGNGDREAPQSAICKLETQERWWYDLVQIRRLENWCSLVLRLRALRPENQELGGLRTGKDGCSSSGRERENFPFLCRFVLSGPSKGLDDALPR